MSIKCVLEGVAFHDQLAHSALQTTGAATIEGVAAAEGGVGAATIERVAVAPAAEAMKPAVESRGTESLKNASNFFSGGFRNMTTQKALIGSLVIVAVGVIIYEVKEIWKKKHEKRGA